MHGTRNGGRDALVAINRRARRGVMRSDDLSTNPATLGG